jgi:hypothetical protein
MVISGFFFFWGGGGGGGGGWVSFIWYPLIIQLVALP